jgi:lysophospholipid hydrolase
MTACLELILDLISPVVHLLNWNSDWLHVEPSEAIAHKGDRCDSVFMVLNGRLRATYRRKAVSLPSTAESVEEYGRGKFIGEVGGLTGTTWPFDVYAIRNSELVRVPIDALLAIIRAHPAAGVHFAAVIASQVQSKYGSRYGAENAPSKGMKSSVPRTVATSGRRPAAVMPSYGLNLATIAVVPLTSVDVTGFCSVLLSSLKEIAPSALITKAIAREHLGDKTYQPGNSLHELKMTRFLGDAEEKHRIVVYQSDLRYTWWTQLAVKQADCILLLVRADEAPQEKQVERCLAWAYDSMRVRIELVIISDKDSVGDEDGVIRNQLDDWTEKREWVTGHQRIRTPFDYHGKDFMRMCRRITGRSVGLALGGGGARGLAHLGIIRALMEAGITVDMVGGTSQGAYIGALFAENPDRPEIVWNKAREMSSTMSSTKEKLLDLTLPMTSMFSGYRFNLGIQKSFGTNLRIQDLVLHFFCVSVDIQRRNLVVHRKGLLWKFVRASMVCQKLW